MKQILLKTKILLFLAILSIYSCKKDDEVQYCETLENIVGTWRWDQNVETFTFTYNYDFIDSLYSGEFNEKLEYVVKGKFKFINGFLELNNLKYIYLNDMRPTSSFSYRYSTYKFEIIDDRLFMNAIGVFRPQGHSGYEINGKWQSTRNIIVYDSEQSPSFVLGNQIIEYEFNKETNLCSVNCTDYYGIKQNSYVDGQFVYRYDFPNIYSSTNEIPMGKLESGILFMNSEGLRTYNRVE